MKRTIILLCTALAFGACSKEPLQVQKDEISPLMAAKLVGDAWTLTTEGVDWNRNDWIDPDEWGAPDSCDAAAVCRLFSDGTGTFGPMPVCQNSRVATLAAKWTVSYNGKILEWTSNGRYAAGKYEIKSLTENVLIVKTSRWVPIEPEDFFNGYYVYCEKGFSR
jgi:hypothetical protein